MGIRGRPFDPEFDPLPRLAHQLRERVKELDCLFGISDIIERSGGDLEKILQETVELLPGSWNHPEVACACLSLGDMEFRSPSFQEGPWTQEAEILVHGEKAGILQISYTQPRPPQDEGPFFREERRLLKAVAERMGHIVERLSAEERLREKEEEFRERMTHVTRISTMGEMASSIAHEVNQPLTAIATFAQAGRRLVESGHMEAPEIIEVLERIGDEALRAGDIIHRLRGLVQKRESKLSLCDLNELLQEIAPLALVDARLNGVELQWNPATDPMVVLADGVQIQQVVLNLVRNGIDAMIDTPPSAKVLTVTSLPLDGDRVVVRVSDRGCGIPEGSEPTLFEPFFTTKQSGLGLGLSISRSIIGAHGGELVFSRNRGEGTTFSVSLPLAGEVDHD